jgi:hypothetical protein
VIASDFSYTFDLCGFARWPSILLNRRSMSGRSSTADCPEEALLGHFEVSVDDDSPAIIEVGTHDILQAGPTPEGITSFRTTIRLEMC